jgi:hypothetical protein
MLAMASAGRKLTIATWNIAAINNNPFEYWVTIPDNPAYEELMINVEKFLDAPGDKDVSVSNVFTDDMFGELDKQMTDIGWPSVRTYWDDDFKKRKIISGFMKVSFVFIFSLKVNDVFAHSSLTLSNIRIHQTHHSLTTEPALFYV